MFRVIDQKIVEQEADKVDRYKDYGPRSESPDVDKGDFKTVVNLAPNRASLPDDPKERKQYPIASGVLDYFPDALAAIAHVSYQGSVQHHPDKPMHWDRNKSKDEADTMIRHFLQRGTRDRDGERHTAKMAWRALALLQKEIEEEARKM